MYSGAQTLKPHLDPTILPNMGITAVGAFRRWAFWSYQAPPSSVRYTGMRAETPYHRYGPLFGRRRRSGVSAGSCGTTNGGFKRVATRCDGALALLRQYTAVPNVIKPRLPLPVKAEAARGCEGDLGRHMPSFLGARALYMHLSRDHLGHLTWYGRDTTASRRTGRGRCRRGGTSGVQGVAYVRINATPTFSPACQSALCNSRAHVHSCRSCRSCSRRQCAAKPPHAVRARL
jgi:hypothetical protein